MGRHVGMRRKSLVAWLWSRHVAPWSCCGRIMVSLLRCCGVVVHGYCCLVVPWLLHGGVASLLCDVAVRGLEKRGG
jgi:hypothetical protein